MEVIEHSNGGNELETTETQPAFIYETFEGKKQVTEAWLSERKVSTLESWSLKFVELKGKLLIKLIGVSTDGGTVRDWESSSIKSALASNLALSTTGSVYRVHEYDPERWPNFPVPKEVSQVLSTIGLPSNWVEFHSYIVNLRKSTSSQAVTSRIGGKSTASSLPPKKTASSAPPSTLSAFESAPKHSNKSNLSNLMTFSSEENDTSPVHQQQKPDLEGYDSEDSLDGIISAVKAKIREKSPMPSSDRRQRITSARNSILDIDSQKKTLAHRSRIIEASQSPIAPIRVIDFGSAFGEPEIGEYSSFSTRRDDVARVSVAPKSAERPKPKFAPAVVSTLPFSELEQPDSDYEPDDLDFDDEENAGSTAHRKLSKNSKKKIQPKKPKEPKETKVIKENKDPKQHREPVPPSPRRTSANTGLKFVEVKPSVWNLPLSSKKLSYEERKRIEEEDQRNFLASLEAGVPLDEMNESVTTTRRGRVIVKPDAMIFRSRKIYDNQGNVVGVRNVEGPATSIMAGDENDEYLGLSEPTSDILPMVNVATNIPLHQIAPKSRPVGLAPMRKRMKLFEQSEGEFEVPLSSSQHVISASIPAPRESRPRVEMIRKLGDSDDHNTMDLDIDKYVIPQPNFNLASMPLDEASTDSESADSDYQHVFTLPSPVSTYKKTSPTQQQQSKTFESIAPTSPSRTGTSAKYSAAKPTSSVEATTTKFNSPSIITTNATGGVKVKYVAPTAGLPKPMPSPQLAKTAQSAKPSPSRSSFTQVMASASAPPEQQLKWLEEGSKFEPLQGSHTDTPLQSSTSLHPIHSLSLSRPHLDAPVFESASSGKQSVSDYVDPNNGTPNGGANGGASDSAEPTLALAFTQAKSNNTVAKRTEAKETSEKNGKEEAKGSNATFSSPKPRKSLDEAIDEVLNSPELMLSPQSTLQKRTRLENGRTENSPPGSPSTAPLSKRSTTRSASAAVPTIVEPPAPVIIAPTIVDDDSWTTSQEKLLQEAVLVANPTSLTYLADIARKIPGKTAAQIKKKLEHVKETDEGVIYAQKWRPRKEETEEDLDLDIDEDMRKKRNLTKLQRLEAQEMAQRQDFDIFEEGPPTGSKKRPSSRKAKSNAAKKSTAKVIRTEEQEIEKVNGEKKRKRDSVSDSSATDSDASDDFLSVTTDRWQVDKYRQRMSKDIMTRNSNPLEIPKSGARQQASKATGTLTKSQKASSASFSEGLELLSTVSTKQRRLREQLDDQDEFEEAGDEYLADYEEE